MDTSQHNVWIKVTSACLKDQIKSSQRCLHLNTTLGSTTARWGEDSTSRLLAVAVPFSQWEQRQHDHMNTAVLLVSAVCRVTWHDLDRFNPGQEEAWSCWVYNSSECFWSWIKPYGAMYSSMYQFTLAKVVPDIEHSGWTRRSGQPADFCPGYTRLPGQETTVRATRLRCSFSMGTSAEWLIPAVDRPLTATIMSPHLEQHRVVGQWGVWGLK